jgi:hypothetical protein
VALQKRRDRLRVRLGLILDQRGADTADLPGGASGLLVRDYKGKELLSNWNLRSRRGLLCEALQGLYSAAQGKGASNAGPLALHPLPRSAGHSIRKENHPRQVYPFFRIILYWKRSFISGSS